MAFYKPNLGRLKIREENILSMKIRADDIDIIDAERFDSFSSIIINCKKCIAALKIYCLAFY